jgi:hypothetical protein
MGQMRLQPTKPLLPVRIVVSNIKLDLLPRGIIQEDSARANESYRLFQQCELLLRIR